MKGDSSVREHLRKVVESLVDISGKEEKEEETPATTGGEEEKEEKEEKKEKKPSVVWCSFHTQTLCSVPEGLKEVKGLSVLPEPSELIDYKNVFEAAEKEFRRICTNGEEYLPKMPNPEDIIWSSEEKAEKDSGEKEEQKPKEGEDVKKSEVPAEEPAEVKPADVPAVTAEEEEEKTTTTTSNN